jgi:ribosomal-protein-alanine N-acetyltransferase
MIAERKPDRAPGEIVAREMTVDDIPGVLAIDQQSFPNPWPEHTYRYELRENPAAHLIVLEEPAAGRIVGIAGYWLVVDEAHISTFAIHPDYRRRGLGRLLLAAMLADADRRGAVLATLEVRVGNEAAQRLYRSFDFRQVGRRRGYYRDNGEDALLMTATKLIHPGFDVQGGA